MKNLLLLCLIILLAGCRGEKKSEYAGEWLGSLSNEVVPTRGGGSGDNQQANDQGEDDSDDSSGDQDAANEGADTDDSDEPASDDAASDSASEDADTGDETESGDGSSTEPGFRMVLNADLTGSIETPNGQSYSLTWSDLESQVLAKSDDGLERFFLKRNDGSLFHRVKSESEDGEKIEKDYIFKKLQPTN